MAEEARHHHHIPQGYLRGFAQQRSARQWYINVTDLEQKKTFTTNVRNVCGERDFMRVEMEGYEPDKIEKEMSNFEAQCIDAIRRIAQTGKFEGDDANQAMNLMALFAVRSPEMRENIRDFHERIAKRTMDLVLAKKERWEGQMQQLRDAEKQVNEDLTYEDMKEFHERGEYDVTVRREYHIGTEFRLMPKVLEEIGKRLWTVYRTDGKHGEFVTTNHPVTLTFIEPDKLPAWARSPGFALRGTEIHFPLTRHAMLVGRWDKGQPWDRPGYTEVADPSFIAAVNTHMARHSFGQVFSREKEILYVDALLRIRRDEKLIEHLLTKATPEEIAEFKARFGITDNPERSAA